MASTPIACFTCGGSYTADQRRRHEQTAKHQDALAPAVAANIEALNGHAEPEVPAGTVNEKGSVSELPKRAKEVPFPAEAAEIDRLIKLVGKRAADVRWTEKHMDGKDPVATLAKRRALLAEAEAAVTAALMSIPETGN